MENKNFLKLLEHSDKDQLLKMMDAMLTIEYKRHILKPVISSIREKLWLKNEEDVIKYIDALNPYELSDMLKILCSHEIMIKELNGLSSETKEELVNYYKRKNRIKIERGIISYNNRNEVIVQSPGHIYHLNHLDFYGSNLSDDQKVLGLIIKNKFSIFREFISATGHFVFGYVIDEVKSSKLMKIQTIDGYDKRNFDPYQADYSLGAEALAEVN